MRLSRWAGAVSAFCFLSLAWPGNTDAAERHVLLDVPYLAQTPELCGGAAAAMVLRYWGRKDVFPEDFQSLIRRSDAGIPTESLTTAINGRGVPTVEVHTFDDLGRALERGRPVIALVQSAPHLFHYVVVVGVTPDHVVFHDPARTPFRTATVQEFDRDWAAADRWALVVLPPATAATSAGTAATSAPSSDPAARTGPCGALVDRGVDLARAGDHSGAEEHFFTAAEFCPNDVEPLRELAGLRFLESRWTDARDLALRALAIAPDDTSARTLLATSQYLSDDPLGALETWNRMGQPATDVVDISDDGRTHQPAIARLIGLQPRALLTAAAFERARRRLDELPSASTTSLRYTPIDDGRAKVDAVVDERDVLPNHLVPLASVVGRALILDTLQVDIADAAGDGELWETAWQWAPGRPRVGFDVALPSPVPLPGILALDVFWERQSYGTDPLMANPADVEERRAALFTLSDWSSSVLRWEAGSGLDHLESHDHVTVHGAIDRRFAADRLSLGLGGDWWAPSADAASFGSAQWFLSWRSSTHGVPAWTSTTQLSTASATAPLALWSGAGTGQGRGLLLRAHPLLTDDGVIDGAAFGRTVVADTEEYEHRIVRTIVGALGIAGFVDTGKAWHRLEGDPNSPWLVDVGVGIRFHGTSQGESFRVDFARGLTDGHMALSAGWITTWPR